MELKRKIVNGIIIGINFSRKALVPASQINNKTLSLQDTLASRHLLVFETLVGLREKYSLLGEALPHPSFYFQFHSFSFTNKIIYCTQQSYLVKEAIRISSPNFQKYCSLVFASYSALSWSFSLNTTMN